LKKLGWSQPSRRVTAKLGELLLASELISQVQLNDALTTSQETGLPLGRVLVIKNVLSDELLSSALTAQILIRDGKVSKDHAVQGLKSAKRRRVSIEESLMEHGFYRPPVRQSVKLGELLVLGGLITETDVMGALEMGLLKEMPVGQVLVDMGLITQDSLTAALKLQNMVANGTLTPLQAAESMQEVAHKGSSVSKAVASVELSQPEPNEI